ncbi:MAG TPA: M23 family metallopeptidase [Candidatus Dormibacteraeota bacterium]
MRLNRYVTHAVVLLIATVMTGYSVSVKLGPVHGAINAEAGNAQGSVGDISLGRSATIIKPVSIPTSALPSRAPILYKVMPGDTLDTIAKAMGIPFREITWSNPHLRLPLKPGLVLRIPPVPGFVLVVRAGDSLTSLASQYGFDPTAAIDINRINGALTPGTVLVIPVDPKLGPDLSTGVPADPIVPGRLSCPIQGAPIIQKFGPTSFALEPSYGGYPHFHTGVDLLAGYGTPIVAAAGGTVTAAGPAFDFGIRVEITDSYGLVEIYAHMSEVAAGVTVGQRVQQGKEIGLVGSTGLSIGAHLHFQFEIGGVPTDPLPLIGC